MTGTNDAMDAAFERTLRLIQTIQQTMLNCDALVHLCALGLER